MVNEGHRGSPGTSPHAARIMRPAASRPVPVEDPRDRRSTPNALRSSGCKKVFCGLAALSLLLCAAPSSAQNPAATVNVDVNANRRPINPNVYGVAHATTAQLNDLNAPLNRHGGNDTTRYNWQLNADNRGNDWYYESIPRAESSATTSRARRSCAAIGRRDRSGIRTTRIRRGSMTRSC